MALPVSTKSQLRFPIASATSPGIKCAAVIPSDTVELTVGGTYPRALFVGTGGNVAIVQVGDDTSTGVVFKNVPSGSILPVMCRGVLATGTTATDIVAISD